MMDSGERDALRDVKLTFEQRQDAKREARKQ